MQVGCTINYGRKVLWKKWEKLRTISFWQKCGNSRPRLFVERSSTPLHSQLGTLFRDRLALTIWVRSARILKAVRNGQSVVSPNSGPVAQLGARFHGMEEVVGSIPTRSTKSLNNLDRETRRRHGVCVMVCAVTRRFGAHGKGFHRRPLRFHPHMALQRSNGSTNPMHAIGFSVYLGQLSASTIFATARLLSSRRTVRRIQRSWRLPDTSAVAC